MKDRPHFIWIMVDSVRRYHTTGDDRSRLSYMDVFSEQSVEFLNCMTSAPSTLMSLSASLTGLPAYFLAQNYKDFQFNTDYFETFNSVLKEEGYETNRAVIMHPEVRIKLKQFDILPKRFWPSGYSHIHWFNNQMVLETIKSALSHPEILNSQKPNFWFIDFNCRNDKNISQRVSQTVDLFHKGGYNSENTVFLISSDHGYPDPSLGINPEYLRRKKMTHDMFLSDDNIMIPFLLKYPGCPEGKKINQLVTTLDLLPTLFDLLGIKKKPKFDLSGCSLVSILNGEAKREGFFGRCDARWQGQPNRITAIRSDQYKLVYDHDQESKSFFRIGGDLHPGIDVPLLNKDYEESMKPFVEYLERTESQAVQLQVEFFLSKLEEKYALSNCNLVFHLDSDQLATYFKQRTKDLCFGSKKIHIVQFRDDVNFLKRLFNRVVPYSGNYRNNESFKSKLLVTIDEVIKSYTFSKTLFKEEPTLVFTYPFFILKRFLGRGEKMPSYND